MYALDVASSFAASFARLGTGVMTEAPARRPAEHLRLYEFEGCPFCRRVRDALTELDLEALILPCPKGGQFYRQQVLERGGKAQFPYLEDPNEDLSLYESDAILAHLYATYGRRPVPLFRRTPLDTLSSALASAARPAGFRARASKRPDEPLHLWSFEESPFCRLVRERLCELELPYVLHNVGRGRWVDNVPLQLRRPLRWAPEPSTPSRRELERRAGRLQVPYLEDPNTGTTLLESRAIDAYLESTYAL